MNEHLRLAIDHLHEGVQVISRDWRYLYVNETAAIHGRRSAVELVGERLHDCYPGIEQTPLFTALERVMTTRQSERMRNESAYPNGDRGWFDLRLEPVPAGLCVLSVDVTADQRRQDRLLAVESQLVQAQKMEALGRLAGGVAHDFNNQLTAILGFTQMLLEQRPSAEMERDLREIEAAADRSAALIRQLLAFGKRQLLRFEPVSLPDLVGNVTRLLERVLGARVRCDLKIDPATEFILADAAQLEHVLTNLAVNARDAMSTGGRLTISTGTIEVGADRARGHASVAPGRYSVLSVADSGHGMDDETKARIFEPFFTTKEAGQGTGLGLAIVYGIVQQMNGFIFVDSELGQGTTFSLYLPVTAERKSEEAPAPVETAVTADAAAVLVVEDDRGVREFVSQSLAHHGYRVRVAESADDAWDALREPGCVDLLLLDIVLPGEPHPALMEHIEHTGLPVMLMSGYSEQHVKHPRLTQAAPLLEKPFTVDQLLRAVRDALRSSATRPAWPASAAPKVAVHADHVAVGASNAEV